MDESALKDPAPKKALRLVDYLLALASLRTAVIREVGDYQGILWLHEIPHDKGCFTQAWGRNEEFGLDVWIEVKKHDEPVLQDVPKQCEQWVDNSTLYQTTDLPKLYPTINVQVELKDEQEEIPRFVTEVWKVEDHPEVQEAWEKYLEEKWLPWADLHRRWQSVQKVYAKLFTFHQEQQRLGEEYELVLGLGLLSWRTATGHIVRRHLVTAKASLEFEAKLGLFSVGPAPDGAKVSVELDMLDVEDQPVNVQQSATNGLTPAEENPWDRATVDPVLSGLAKALHNLGEYHPEPLEPQQARASEKPFVEYAPALILRKRSLKGLQETLRKMRLQISKGGEIPTEFRDLSEGGMRRESKSLESGETSSSFDQTIYFPKPSNEEQRQIVEKLRYTSGVLVQGPPGTGKSHTIANLICHLLANGQRVLVTAQTPRALLVLQDKLPTQLQPLCINLLGSGIEEQRSLEASVSGILTEQDRWSESRADTQVTALTQTINKLREEKAEKEFRLRSIRESDTCHQSVINGAYQGTAAQIALRLANESAKHGWLADKIRFDQEMPVSQSDLEKVRQILCALTPELEAELQAGIPDPVTDFAPAEVMERLVRQESEAKGLLGTNHALLSSQLGQALAHADLQRINQVIDAVSTLVQAIQSIRKRPMAWIEKAVFDVLSDRDTPWKELQRLSVRSLSGLKEKARRIDRYSVEITISVNRKKLLNDARTLKWHFEEGGSLGWGPLWSPFRPKAVKDNWHIIESVRIDGSACDSPEFVNMLVEYLSMEEQIEYVWKQWIGKAERQPGSMIMHVAELEELLEALNSVVGLLDYVERAKAAIRLISGVGESAWHDSNAIKLLLETSYAVIAQNALAEVQQELEKHESKIRLFSNEPNAHPLIHDVLQAILRRDLQYYRRICTRLSELRQLAESLKWVKDTLRKIQGVAPLFAQELQGTAKDERWVNRTSNMEKAWSWARARSWLQDFLNAEDVPSLERRVRQIEDEIKDTLAQLAAVRAWKFCFKRLEEHHRRHLMGWQQAIKKLGKGTGKHAPKHRRDAQSHLSECRDAVPAWVMPLHRVWETVDPSPGMFDIVIVDEASQCGPEALPLTYLAKKLLVVGDDQQISPEAVGVGRDAIHRLMREYLYDFEHADSFDVESSLFDHGKRRFNNRIVLREHFRCMPEIIRFSNDLCYHATPLIPLRQYPPQRLEPLKAVHVPSGYREGKNQRVINRPEAEALVETVVQCCNDDRYEGKSMGVIVLQGEAQAELIESMLLNELGEEEIEQRRLVCGNPYSFQGDERHVIFLSMVAAPNERIGPFTQASDQRRFNVAASRAQDQMWLFHTATRNDLSEVCLRRRLLEYFENPTSQITKALGEDAEHLRQLAHSANRQVEKPPKPFDSWFEVDVALSIAARGYRVIPQYPFAVKHIDLVIEGAQSQLAVECDGDYWHGPEQYEQDMERQRILERCGWHFHRIRECLFNANSEAALRNLWQVLDQRGIRPISDTNNSRDESLRGQSGPGPHDRSGVGNSQAYSERARSPQTSSRFISTPGVGQQSFLSSSLSHDEKPSNIHEALAMKTGKLRAVILDVLRTRPNFSCQKEALAGFVLKYLEVITRGEPRKQFERKAKQALGYLKANGQIKEYKTPKNVRIKLTIDSGSE